MKKQSPLLQARNIVDRGAPRPKRTAARPQKPAPPVLDPRAAAAFSVYVAPGECEDCDKLRSDLYRQIGPVGPLELTLFDQLFAASWNLRRIRILEAKLAQQAGYQDCAELILSSDPHHLKQFQLLEQYQVRNERTFHRCLRELRDLQNHRAATDVSEKVLPPAFPQLANPGKFFRARIQTETAQRPRHAAREKDRSSPHSAHHPGATPVPPDEPIPGAG